MSFGVVLLTSDALIGARDISMSPVSERSWQGERGLTDGGRSSEAAVKPECTALGTGESGTSPRKSAGDCISHKCTAVHTYTH